MPNIHFIRQLVYGCVLVGLTASIQYSPIDQVVDQDCALVLNSPRSSVYDYGLNLLRGNGGAGLRQACITYDDINQAYIDAMKRINVAQPQGTDWKTDEIATVGELLLDITAQLTKRFGLTVDEVEKGLPLIDTSKTLIRDVCPPYLATVECHAGKYRRHDGLCNNLNNPTWGATMTPFTRLVPPHYADGLSAPRISILGHDLPISRIVSRTMHPDEGFHDHAGTVMVVAWGQFMDHDFTLTATPLDARNKNEPEECCGRPAHLKHPYCMDLEIPDDDYFYHQYGIKCQDFVRSFPAARPGCRLGSKLPYNTLTGVIDGNTVYGVTEEFSRHLRAGIGGQLRMNPVFAEYGLKELLPLKLDIPEEGCTRSNSSQYCFEAGEIRVNEQLVLTCMHTIMAREHNRVAMELNKINPHWDDETLYQEARRIVIAEIQHITFNEFLPIILGKDVMEKFGLMLQKEGYWDGYDPEVNPNIIAAFSAAAFRFGHSLLPTAVERWSKAHKFISSKRLSDLIRRPYDLYRAGVMDEYLMGLMNQVAQAMDDSITQEVTNHLLKKPGHHFGLDLVAFNMQRGREFGVPGYMEYRKFCGLDISDTFEGMFGSMPNTTVFRYASIFDHPADVDLWSGGVSERPLPGSMLGPTFACVIATQMSFVRRGDRFWYELPNQPSSFTPEQLQEIRNIKMSRILCDNTDLIDTIQIYPMVLPDHEINPRVPCRSGIIPSIDLTKWAEFPGGHIGDNLQFATDEKRELKKELGANKTAHPLNITEFSQEKPEKEAVTLKIFTVKEKPSIRLQILDNEIVAGDSANYVATSPVLYITMNSPRTKRDILKIHSQRKPVSNLTETSETKASPAVRMKKAEMKIQARLKRPQRRFPTNTWTTIRKSMPEKTQFESVRTQSLNKQKPKSDEIVTRNHEINKKGRKQKEERENEEEGEYNSQKIVDVHDELDLQYEYVPLKQADNGKMYVVPSSSTVDNNENYGENFYQNIHDANYGELSNKHNDFGEKTPNYNSHNEVPPNYNNNDGETPNYNSNNGETPNYNNNDGETPNYNSNNGERPTYKSYSEVPPNYNNNNREAPNYNNNNGETPNYNSNNGETPNYNNNNEIVPNYNSDSKVTSDYKNNDELTSNYNNYNAVPNYNSDNVEPTNYNSDNKLTHKYNTNDGLTENYNNNDESSNYNNKPNYGETPNYNTNNGVTPNYNNDAEDNIYIVTPSYDNSYDEVTPRYNNHGQYSIYDKETHNYNSNSGAVPSFNGYVKNSNYEFTPTFNNKTEDSVYIVTPSYDNSYDEATPHYNSYTESTSNEEVTTPSYNSYSQTGNEEITPNVYNYAQNNFYDLPPSLNGYTFDTPRKPAPEESGFHEAGVDFVLPVDLTVKHPIERYIIHPLAGSTATRGFGHDFKPIRGSAVTGPYGSQQPMRFKTVGSFTTDQLHKPIYIQGVNLTNTTDNTTKRPLHGINLVRDVAPHGPTPVPVPTSKPSLIYGDLIINVPPLPLLPPGSPFVPYDYDSHYPSPTAGPESNSGSSGGPPEDYTDYDESSEDSGNKNNSEENYSRPDSRPKDEETSDYQKGQDGYTFTKDEQIESEIPVWTIHESGGLGDYSGAAYIDESEYKEDGNTDTNGGTQTSTEEEDYDGEEEGEDGEREEGEGGQSEEDYEDSSDESDPETEGSKKKFTLTNKENSEEKTDSKLGHDKNKQTPVSSASSPNQKRSRKQNGHRVKTNRKQQMVDSVRTVKNTGDQQGDVTNDGARNSDRHSGNDEKTQTARRRTKSRNVQSRNLNKQSNQEESSDSTQQREKEKKTGDESLHKTLERILDGRDSITRVEDIPSDKKATSYSNYWTLEYSFPHE